MVLTASQLTFYDVTDGEVSFVIISENIDDTGKLNLRAVLTEQGQEVTDTGCCQWYKYNSSSMTFEMIADAQDSALNVDFIEDDIYKCDFSYDSSASSDKIFVYSAYYNVTTRRMIYLSRPSDGRYMKDDLWVVGDEGDYIISEDDDSEVVYTNTMLKATTNGNGQYSSTHWELALGYDNLLDSIQTDLGVLSEIKEDVSEIKNEQLNLSHKIDLSPSDGLIIRSRFENGEEGPFKAIFNSEQLTFEYDGDAVAWISGDTDTTDSHPQFYVQDAMIKGNIHVTNNITIGNPHKDDDVKLVFQPETNGSFSILISK